MRITTFFLFVACTMAISTNVFGQQDPMFTKYMFNSLSFNPGYAGSHDHMTVNLLHRQQWVGVNGAPVTQSLTLHSPLRNDRVGVGFSLLNDAIGAVGTLDANASYAYRIPLGKKTKLAVGLQAGVTNWRSDWSKVTRKDAVDQVFDDNVNKWLPNFGAGLYLQNKKYYLGLGCPKLVEYDLRKADATTTPLYAKSYRHYFATAGLALPLGSENVVFKPSILVKSASWFGSFRKDAAFNKIGAPDEFDIDLSFFLQQTLWVGAAYRSAIQLNKSSNDSVDFWVAYFLKNGMRIGVAYDYTLTDIRKVTNGSYEVMLGYEFDYKTKRVVTPRYF
jgi:type IX secretion system PorP/SprF family membrane protein